MTMPRANACLWAKCTCQIQDVLAKTSSQINSGAMACVILIYLHCMFSFFEVYESVILDLLNTINITVCFERSVDNLFCCLHGEVLQIQNFHLHRSTKDNYSMSGWRDVFLETIRQPFSVAQRINDVFVSLKVDNKCYLGHDFIRRFFNWICPVHWNSIVEGFHFGWAQSSSGLSKVIILF